MPEPILTEIDGPGRPSPTDEQFVLWLEEMRPYLEMASSLYHACNKAGIPQHYTVIRRKYNLKDWFSLKVDAYRRKPGETVNEAYVILVERITDKIKKDIPISREEKDIIEHFSKTHRTAQPFFVTRTENAEVKNDEDLGKVLDTLDSKTDYGKLGQEIGEQGVAPNSPLQNQE